MFLYILTITFSFMLVYFLYLYKKIHYHFDRNGIKYIKGFPIFGNILKSTFLMRHTVEDIDAVYKAFPEERYVGFIEGTRPIIIVRDPELIKLITVKDFDSFTSRHKSFPVEIFPLLGRGLISMEGDEGWRKMRTQLSPTFTGSKLRYMLPCVTEICKNYVEYLKEKESESIDVLDLIQRYTTDVFASAGFGIHINSVKDRDNKFYKAGQDGVTLTFWKRIGFYLATQSSIFAKILHFLGVRMMSNENTEFFRSIVRENIEYRKKNDIKRPDLIHFLTEASDDWTPDDITGQALSFFFADFEALSSSITMCIHELSLNPVFQEKLYQEIKEISDSDEKITLEALNDIPYLNCILSETTRKWSAAIVLDRVCTQAYDLPPPNKGGKPYRVKPGQSIYNAANSIHLDPKYHPEPEVYNPDRFSEENKHNIIPFTYIPFGVGPRNCLGFRFAKMQMNTIIYYLVKNFKILKCEKTSDPICLMPNKLSIKAIGNTWIQVQPRD